MKERILEVALEDVPSLKEKEYDGKLHHKQISILKSI